MTDKYIIPHSGQLARGGIKGVPALFLDAGEKAWWRFVEFFTANIRNKNTREAYGRAVLRFSDWCSEKKIELHQVNPFLTVQRGFRRRIYAAAFCERSLLAGCVVGGSK